MTKKSLLFVNGHLNTGGIEKSLVDLLAVIDYERYDVDLLLFNGLGDYYDLVPKEVRVISVDVRHAYGVFWGTLINNLKRGAYSLVYYRFISLLSRLIGDRVYALLRPILHIRSSYYCAIAYRTGFCASIVAYSVRAKKKYCWWHNGHVVFTKSTIRNTAKIWNHYSGIVAVSYGCKRKLVQHFPKLADKIYVMYNVLNGPLIHKKSDPQPEEYASSLFNIVSVGRLSPIKHFDNIVYVASALSQRVSGFKWFIIGDGPEKDNLRTLIEMEGLSDRVILLGKRINPYPYIKYADFLVHTSYYEAHCTTILEAMALKTPCVVTRTVIPQDYIKDGENCIEVERNPQALYEGVIEMINNPDKAVQMAEYAYGKVVSDYSPEVISGSFYSIIEQ